MHRKEIGGSKNGRAETNVEAVSAVEEMWGQLGFIDDGGGESRHTFYRVQSMPAFQTHHKFVHLVFILTALNHCISITSISSPSLLVSKTTDHSLCNLATLTSASKLTCVFSHPYLRWFLLRVKGEPRLLWPPDFYTRCSFCEAHPVLIPFTQLTCIWFSSLSSEFFFQEFFSNPF